VPPAGEPTEDVHDDVSEAMAAVVERDEPRWDPVAGRQIAFWTAVLLLLLGAGALSSQRGTDGADGAGALAAAVTVALLAGAVRLGAMPGAALQALMAGHLSCVYAADAVLCWSWRTPPGAVPGAPVALVGGAVCATALALLLGARRERLFLLPAVTAGAVCAATGLVMQTTPFDPELPLTTLLTLVVLSTSGLPALALSTCGAGRHALSVGPSSSGVDRSGTDRSGTDRPGTDWTGTDWTGIDMERLAADCRLAREMLVALAATAGTLLVLLAPFAVSLGGAGAAVPLLGSAAVILRTRRYRSAHDVRVGLVFGVLGLVSTALSLIVLEPGSRVAVAAMAVAAGVSVALAAHDLPHRRTSRDAVHGAGEVERFLHRPELVVPVGREQLGGIAGRDPADGHDGVRRQHAVDVEHAVDPQLATRSRPRTGEHRDPGRHEDLVLDRRPVEVGVRADEDRVPDPQRVLGAAAEHRVLHHEYVGADLDRSAVAGDHGPVEHPATGSDRDVPADNGRGRDPRRGIDP
jgi:hypothetical protein